MKEICPLTNHEITLYLDASGKRIYTYNNPILGVVSVTEIGLIVMKSLKVSEKDIIKGMIRNANENGSTIAIDSNLLKQLENQDIPYDFESRANHFLEYLYNHGGKEYKTFNLNSSVDSPLTYSSRDEFERIIRYLKSEGFIDYESKISTMECEIYQALSITKEGIKELKKEYTHMPLIGLVNQKISTGDKAIDDKIDHARALFFDNPVTLDKMRSGCETLIFVMEPIRKELEGMFEGDTEVFFNLVNNFTIRHNKVSTRVIENPEQLEWIYYSLLNTINTYVKMKRKVVK